VSFFNLVFSFAQAKQASKVISSAGLAVYERMIADVQNARRIAELMARYDRDDHHGVVALVDAQTDHQVSARRISDAARAVHQKCVARAKRH